MANRKMIAHGMSRDDWRVPGVENYEHRSAVAQGPDDLLIFSLPLDPAYLAYREELLGFSNDNIFVTQGAGWNLAQRIAADENLLKILRAQINGNGQTRFDAFYVSQHEEELARLLGIKLFGSAALTPKVGSKSGFRELAKKAGVGLAEGFENLDAWEVEEHARILLEQGKEVVVKDDHGVSGLNNYLISPEALTLDLTAEVGRALEATNFQIGVVEHFLPNVSGTFGVQCYISEHRNKILHGFWRQILEGRNMEYVGSFFPNPIPETLERRIKYQCNCLMHEYRLAGWRGYLNFDFLILNDGEIIFVECNARKSAPYYPRKFLELQGLEDVCVVCKLFKSDKFKNMDFARLVRLSEGLLYSQAKPQGIVFFNAGIMSHGQIQVIIIGKDWRDVNFFDKALAFRLRKA